MKYKVIITEQGKIVIDETAKIRKDDWAWDDYNKVIFKSGSNNPGGSFKIIATIKFSLDKDVLMVIVEDGVEELGKNIVNYVKKYEKTDKYNDVLLAIQFGYSQKENDEKGVYSEEDLLDAWELGAKEGLPLTKVKKDKLLQSLKQEYIELEMENKYNVYQSCCRSKEECYCNKIKTNRDKNGQLIAYLKQ